MTTYTLESEAGTSLRAAGWLVAGKTKPTAGGWRKHDHLERNETEVLKLVKHRWEIRTKDFGDDTAEGLI